MTGRLSGKKAIVTDRSRGTGAATAKRLAADGAAVVITYAGNQAAANETDAAISVGGAFEKEMHFDDVSGDAVRASIRRAATLISGIDIPVHNAGITRMAPAPVETEESFRKQFGINDDGVFVGTATAIPLMHDNGRVLIIGGVNAHTMPSAGGAICDTTKVAVAGLTRG